MVFSQSHLCCALICKLASVADNSLNAFSFSLFLFSFFCFLLIIKSIKFVRKLAEKECEGHVITTSIFIDLNIVTLFFVFEGIVN